MAKVSYSAVSICSILNINLYKNELITFVGAGGKTSSMFKLAKELRTSGKSVLVTTTTAIFCPEKEDYDKMVVQKDLLCESRRAGGCITVWGREVSSENKLLGVDKNHLNDLFVDNVFDYILVEGDGSKRRPIKAPAEHEPVIPEKSTKIAAVIGMDAYGKRIDSGIVHRPEIFCSLTKSSVSDLVDVRNIIELITEEFGIYKNAPEESGKYLILNKCESDEKIIAANEIIKELERKKIHIDGYFIGSILGIG